MLKIRRPLGRLIFNMGIAIPGKTVFLIETAPRICVICWGKVAGGIGFSIKTTCLDRPQLSGHFIQVPVYLSSLCGNFHCGGKTVIRPSFLHIGRLHHSKTWVLFQYKDLFPGIGIPHYKDKAVVRQSYLYNRKYYTDKTVLMLKQPLLCTVSI